MQQLFDVHSHQIEGQTGGLLLSIEGLPDVPGGMSFAQLSKLEVSRDFVKVPYVHDLELYRKEAIVYFHPRRNGFAVQQVSDYLKGAQCRIVVLDTFSGFAWTPKDYFDLLAQHPNKSFLLAHGGGYQIRDFVQIARFAKNAYIDFSATQEIFGCVQGDGQLDIGTKALICHALVEPRLRSKVLFGSDNPEFSQAKAALFFQQLGSETHELMGANYLKLIQAIR